MSMTSDPFTDETDYLVPEPTNDPASLLEEVEHFLARFCAFPDQHALCAVTLWAAHSHMVEHFHTSPRLALLSPEPASGKTRVLEVLELLTPDSLFCFSATPAAIFRSLSGNNITLLVDECDTIFTRRGKDESNEEMRALLNAGYKRGAKIPRCVGPKHEVQHFNAYCATALAGLGELPDTIMSRAVIIKMRRKSPNETVEPFRHRINAPEGYALRDELEAWAAVAGKQIGNAFPELPSGVTDRPAEVWEPLIAIADAAGGEWPEKAMYACTSLIKVSLERQASLGIRLLADLRGIFGEGENALHTETIIDRLCCVDPSMGNESCWTPPADDAPWADLHGQRINPRKLASFLKHYGVRSVKVKIDGVSKQGYRREHLWDVWERYLSSDSAEVEPTELPEPHNEKVPEVPEVLPFRGWMGPIANQ